MMNILKTILGLVSLCLFNSAVYSADVQKPNVIIVLTDDQRWDTVGSSNPGHVWTPGLDKLSKRSLQFTRAYCAFSLCSPSRAALLTGQYGSRNGVNGLAEGLIRPMDSFVHALRDNGFQTAISGKWHLKNLPKQLGFDWSVTFSGNGPWYGRAVDRNGVEVKPKELVDKYCGEESVRFLRERKKDQPFFLWHCTQLPHMDNRHAWPASQKSLDRYVIDDIELPQTWRGNAEGKPDWLMNTRNRMQARKYGYDKDSRTILQHIKEYRATVSDLDDALLPLWAELDAQNLWSNTVVIFMSDNGWMLGEHGMSSKVLAYEPSIRIPMLIAMPGLEGGGQCERLVSNLDIAPTLLDYAGIPLSPRFQGLSLRPLLDNPDAEFRSEFVYEGVGGYGGVPPMAALVTKEMKCIQTWKTDSGGLALFTEYYHLQKDPEEASNLQNNDALTQKINEAGLTLNAHLESARNIKTSGSEQDTRGNRR